MWGGRGVCGGAGDYGWTCDCDDSDSMVTQGSSLSLSAAITVTVTALSHLRAEGLQVPATIR